MEHPTEDKSSGDFNIDSFSLELMNKVWTIGNRHGPDSQRKAEIQEAIAEAVKPLMVVPSVAHDWEMKAQGIESVIPYIVSKQDQDLLRQHATYKRLEGKRAITTQLMPNMYGEFNHGVRAFFDWLTYRAANNFHGNPTIQAQCDIENKIVLNWARDALESISPELYGQWKDISRLSIENKELKEKIDTLSKIDP